MTDSSLEINFTTAQRVPLSIYCFVMVLFGFFGNGTVLYSSIRYNAIRLDRVSLMLVQNLAVADILYTFCAIFPQLVTDIAGKWVLGKAYCFISAQISFIPGSANALTVLFITSYRLWIVTHPFHDTKKWIVKLIIGMIWLVASSGTVISLAYQCASTFDPDNAKCTSGVYQYDKASSFFNIAVAVIVFLPMLAITIQNVILSVIAIRARRRIKARSNYKALVMVCALSGLFIVSWVPYIIYVILKRKVETPQALDIMAFHCIYLNAFGNPILYTLTNRRFGAYVQGVIFSVCCGLCGKRVDAKSLQQRFPGRPGPTSSTADAKSSSQRETSN